jgi:uncharacterized glyoxalase superfamily protein PhnB
MKARHAPKIKTIAPQFLVDDLKMAVAYYRDVLGFDIDFVYESFYAAVSRDGASIHLKCAPKTISDREHRKANEHLDAYIDVSNVDVLFADLTSRSARVTKELGDRPWQCRDFYVEDIDGYILCFSEGTA